VKTLLDSLRTQNRALNSTVEAVGFLPHQKVGPQPPKPF
jgi:hypothetical protein